jgi:Tfp pilus assembly protein PilE
MYILEGDNMVRTVVKAIAAIVLVSILVLVVYYSYNQYQCQSAKERYEKAVGTLSVSEVPRYLIEYQQACQIGE